MKWNKQLILFLSMLMVSAGMVQAQQSPTNEYTLISPLTLPAGNAHTIAANMAYVLPNLTTANLGVLEGNGNGTMVANDQRDGMDDMVSGILAGNATTVYYGWITILAAYNYQNTDGSFTNPNPPPATACHNTVDANTVDNSLCMNMFLAESGHALNLLMESPFANECPGTPTNPNSVACGTASPYTYAQLIYGIGSGNNVQKYGLVYQIYLATDYLYNQNPLVNNNLVAADEGLYADTGAPNRDLTDANAFAFGALLVSGSNKTLYPSNPTIYISALNLSTNISNYQAMAQWFISNEFSSNNYYTGRTLVNTTTGTYLEGDGVRGFGYDSSYQAIDVREAIYQAINFPTYITGAPAVSTLDGLPMAPVGTTAQLTAFMEQSCHWLEQRFYSSGGTMYVDDTDDTRTGAIPGDNSGSQPTGPGAEGGKSTTYDLNASMFDMLYFAAAFPTRTEGLTDVVNLNLGNQITGSPAHTPTLAYPQTPQLINDTQETKNITINAHPGDVINLPLYWSNTGTSIPWQIEPHSDPPYYDWLQYLNPTTSSPNDFLCCNNTSFSYLLDNQFWIGYRNPFPSGVGAKKINGSYYVSYTWSQSIDQLDDSVAMSLIGGTIAQGVTGTYVTTVTPYFGVLSGTYYSGTPITVTIKVTAQ